MIEIGTHPRVIQKRLGHSSIRTTMDVYGSVLEDVDGDVIAGLGRLLGEPTENVKPRYPLDAMTSVAG